MLKNRLSKLSKTTQNDIVDSALKKASVPLINAMRQNVGKDSWELHDSLGIRKIEGRGVGRKMHVGSISDDREEVEKCYYHEYGGDRRLGSHFMSKSFIETREECKEILFNGLKEHMK